MEKLVLATRRFLRDEEGATAVEYGIMVSLIAVVIIAAVAVIGDKIEDAFQKVANCVTNATQCK